jgi:hypothetical protein
VADFTASSTVRLKRIQGNLFQNSFVNDFGRRDEAEEQAFIKSCVVEPLAQVGLLPLLESNPIQHRHGVTDFNITDNERVRVVVEVKSTHSLSLPMVAGEVIRRFKNGAVDAALLDDAAQAERKRDKLYVTDTIGQLLRYMLMNGCRYGALTSGTRTYFFCITDDNQGNVAEKVFISDAWFVGEENYLRAWAYVYSLSLDSASFFPRPEENPDSSWARSDGSFREESDEDESGDASENKTVRESSNRRIGGSSSTGIPCVPVQDIKFEGVLGYGRNGCVIRAIWDGKQVAVKQFDCGRTGGLERFEREINA